jgi:hypothetical protein
MPEYPKLAGQNAKYAEQQMLDIKSGARANGNRRHEGCDAPGQRRGNQGNWPNTFRRSSKAEKPACRA